MKKLFVASALALLLSLSVFPAFAEAEKLPDFTDDFESYEVTGEYIEEDESLTRKWDNNVFRGGDALGMDAHIVNVGKIEYENGSSGNRVLHLENMTGADTFFYMGPGGDYRVKNFTAEFRIKFLTEGVPERSWAGISFRKRANSHYTGTNNLMFVIQRYVESNQIAGHGFAIFNGGSANDLDMMGDLYGEKLSLTKAAYTVPGGKAGEDLPWVNYKLVAEGNRYRIYADGQLVAEAESPADSYDGTLLIGAQRDADGNIFRISQTQVNHLSVYAGVMAEADIAAYDFADAPLPPELVAESAAYTMPGAFVGNGSDRALDTGVKLYDVATKDWTLDTVIDVRKGVNNGVYMSCFSEETGHYRGFMLRQDNADTLTAYVGNSVGVTVDLPQGTSLMHLVVVKSGSQYTIWQDGELVQRVESACDNYDATLLLGAQRDADGNLFRFSNAGIRTLNITDGALSDTDAAALSAPVKDNSRF